MSSLIKAPLGASVPDTNVTDESDMTTRGLFERAYAAITVAGLTPSNISVVANTGGHIHISTHRDNLWAFEDAERVITALGVEHYSLGTGFGPGQVLLWGWTEAGLYVTVLAREAKAVAA